MGANVPCDVRVPVRGYVTFVVSAPTPDEAKEHLLSLFRLDSSNIIPKIEEYILEGNFEFSEIIDEGDQWTAEYNDYYDGPVEF